MSYAKAIAMVFVVLVVLLLTASHVNTRTATAALLLSALLAGRYNGTVPGLFATIAAAVAYSYFFLPPVGFVIRDPNDWIALGVFLVTASVAGAMLAQVQRLRRERDDFEQRYWTLIKATSKTARGSESPDRQESRTT